MRSVVSKLLIILVLISVVSFPFASSSPVIKVFYNGQRISFDVEPIIISGRALVPVRKIFETLGATVTWQATTRRVIAVSPVHRISLTIDRRLATIDNQPHQLDVPATIVDGRTMVPLRFISESMDANVTWDGQNYGIYITTPAAQVASLANIAIDSNLRELIATYGRPARISQSMYGFDWYTYHDSYHNFKMFGVADGKIVAMYSKSDEDLPAIAAHYGDGKNDVRNRLGSRQDYILKGHTKYNYDTSSSDLFTQNGQYIHVFYDALNDNRVSAVLAIKQRQEEKTSGYYGPQTDNLERAFELQLFDIVNAERVLQGLKPYQLHSDLQSVSRSHSQDMIDRNFFSHTNPSGLSPHDRLKQNDYDFSFSAENIACGQFSAIFAHQDFMNSASHREAVLSNAMYMATGVQFGGSYSRYYTETFYTPVR